MNLNVKIERFGFLAVVRREGNQDWRAYQPNPGVEYGRYRSRGHAVSAILGHFHEKNALALAEKAKIDAKIEAMRARMTPKGKR